MKGVILAGGSGTRLHPLTKITSKQLLPVFDKPMIYYPLTTLILAGVSEVLIITRPEDSSSFERLLGDGSDFGIEITYSIQEKPAGLAQAPLIAERFLNGEGFCLILGDNFLYGSGLGRKLQNLTNIQGSTIFAYNVSDPTQYGVVEVDSSGHALSIEEKPKVPKSDLAIPGLYFFDSEIIDICKKLNPSARGELEITDALKEYMRRGSLKVEILPIGTAWLDMGSFESLLEAGEFVHIVQSRQGILIGDPLTAMKTRSKTN
ncbi:sugar nucleotidyltransferase [Candidatus Planktophila dulcis]|uniref:sugar nucleotidyltransferase n=1 Tax=Candidatus Planktophila dulcis TaxID=1884914 RepID=UPI003BEF37C4